MDVPGGAGAVAASEARMVHVRPGRLPSTETSLALCIDRPRAEDPGRVRVDLSSQGSRLKKPLGPAQTVMNLHGKEEVVAPLARGSSGGAVADTVEGATP